MDISTSLSAQALTDLTQRVNVYNKSLDPRGETNNTLGKDDFLKILLTQLTHQDPTKPLEDKEFVAQMAQFSTLEQMSNMNSELSNLYALLARSQAYGLLGKNVEILEGERMITGRVEEVTGSEFPQIRVNDQFYDVMNVTRVINE
jgi:flagellar basal-body rod modification protein FlgD